MYVAIEGIDCVGKSTQIEILKKSFKDAIFTKEPGATKLGEKVRELLLQSEVKISKKAELLLFLADRANHIDLVLSQYKNKLIISDRSFISGIAYARNEFNKETLFDLNFFATSGNFPNKVVFLHANKELIEERLASKKLDTIEKRGIKYFLEIQDELENTLNFLKDKIDFEILKLDASFSIQDIHKQIKEFIDD
ncbi:dTMP kinase [Campylobacter insulaenigrae]|uniref:Thymidylate kinase n=1 Tax=Campylobacter insulaenigrae TaxID=260714 RepID=A0ABY3G2D9_9BACT|nr:dTMP kinase [Campylobacter insulaenigrae]MCR6570114.1 dTMP kinase [Campylobacter insulaenigrae]MCR6571899.1 dTMP kinase [Campylobacter insulaenigrae]MCR6573157.1 dTMP kinase [Campylobacter insulaenigrae]MCR6576374.1 dTMP kinase [Campylobacter insulaenigrae]MCR6579027.1 dTMP kinase [Campylobacter insulaenigrae]